MVVIPKELNIVDHIVYNMMGVTSEETKMRRWIWFKSRRRKRITQQQNEAARVAMTRYMKRGGKVFINIFPHLSLTKYLWKLVWVKVKVNLKYG